MMALLPESTADLRECGKLFADLNHPAVADIEAFAAAIRLNVETLAVIDRIVSESARKVARRHMEIVQQSMADVTGAVRTIPSPGPPQAELLKRACERGASGTRELSDLIRHSNDEALALLKARVDALSAKLQVH
jgi:phasin family protein